MLVADKEKPVATPLIELWAWAAAAKAAAEEELEILREDVPGIPRTSVVVLFIFGVKFKALVTLCFILMAGLRLPVR